MTTMFPAMPGERSAEHGTDATLEKVLAGAYKWGGSRVATWTDQMSEMKKTKTREGAERKVYFPQRAAGKEHATTYECNMDIWLCIFGNDRAHPVVRKKQDKVLCTSLYCYR